MILLKNLRDDLGELGALRVLLPNELQPGGTGGLEDGLRSRSNWPRQKQSLERIRYKFMARISKSDSGCWEWTGYVMRNGYANTYCLSTPILVHRLSWLLFHGPITDGLWVLHRCDNRKCACPEHLFLGTAKENTEDCRSKGRSNRPHGDALPVTKLSIQDVLRIRQRLAAGETHQSIADS